MLKHTWVGQHQKSIFRTTFHGISLWIYRSGRKVNFIKWIAFGLVANVHNRLEFRGIFTDNSQSYQKGKWSKTTCSPCVHWCSCGITLGFVLWVNQILKCLDCFDLFLNDDFFHIDFRTYIIKNQVRQVWYFLRIIDYSWYVPHCECCKTWIPHRSNFRNFRGFTGGYLFYSE